MSSELRVDKIIPTGGVPSDSVSGNTTFFGAGGVIIQKQNKEKEKGKGKEERREKRKKERGEFNLEDPMFLLISILSSKKL